MKARSVRNAFLCLRSKATRSDSESLSRPHPKTSRVSCPSACPSLSTLLSRRARCTKFWSLSEMRLESFRTSDRSRPEHSIRGYRSQTGESDACNHGARSVTFVLARKSPRYALGSITHTFGCGPSGASTGDVSLAQMKVAQTAGAVVKWPRLWASFAAGATVQLRLSSKHAKMLMMSHKYCSSTSTTQTNTQSRDICLECPCFAFHRFASLDPTRGP